MLKHRRSSLRDILVDTKLLSSVAVDLSMYSLAFSDSVAALEVLRLEKNVDELYKQAVAKVLIAFRDMSLIPQAIGLMSLVSSLDTITDVAGDLASTALRGYKPHPHVIPAVCHGDAVGMIRSRRSRAGLPSRVDVLLLKRGDRYEIAPKVEKILEDDIIVVRGPLEEVVEASVALGDEILPHLSCVRQMEGAASQLLTLKSISRSMLDLAFYSLLHNDVSLAGVVVDMEEYADKVYYEILRKTPELSALGEVVTLIALVKGLEELSDAALRIANVVLAGQHSPLLSHVVSEGEEAYLKVMVSGSRRSISSLGLQDRGFVPIALKRERDWISPVVPHEEVEEGDELVLKYYRSGPEGREVEELRPLGLVVT